MNSIKELYEKILGYNGEKILENQILNWIEKNDYAEFIRKIRDSLLNKNIVEISQEVNMELYALSRILDLSTLRFQKNNKKDGSDYLGPLKSIEEYLKLLNSLCLDIVFPNQFNKFDCEIIEAVNGQNNFEIMECLYPSVRIQNLLIKRAGVIISLNQNDCDLDLINNSKIYWTFRRKNRIFQDLSHGWGHNSQWRTEFRMDIETENSYIYNKSGSIDLNKMTENLEQELKEQNLAINEAIELTTFRHFITTVKDDNDLFPYKFKFEEGKLNL